MSDDRSRDELGDAEPGGEAFLFHVVKAIRGGEGRIRTKLESEGWEFVSQARGPLRTEMTFRRTKPTSFGAHLRRAWGAFRRLTPAVQRIAGAGVVVIALLAIVGILAAQGGHDAAPTASPSATAVLPSVTPTGSVSSTTSAVPTTTTPTETSAKKTVQAEAALTPTNNKELAALLATTDYCSDSIARFADKYQGQTIQFDGSISAMNHHDNNKTRYDILVSPGSNGSSSRRGPAFQFRDVNMLDLNLSGQVPDYLGVDDKLNIAARVDEYMPEHGCLFLLEPVATKVR